MKISQGLFFLLVVVQRISSSSVNKKLVVDQKEKDAQRLVRSHPLESHTSQHGYILAHAYEPKLDASQLALKPHEQLAFADTNAYSPSLFNQESLFAPSHHLYGDISKLFTVKAYSKPFLHSYTPKIKSAPAFKIEQPLSFVYTTAKPAPAVSFSAAPVAFASSAYTGVEDLHQHTDTYASKYKFGYRVSDPHTGADFGHSEVSEGHIKKGHYHVLLPDGRIQNVRYWAGPSGYHATVTYEGGHKLV